jgi:NAD(P)-dependent dehydrogenase (short-subunit alcohol dehydrogenase family)
MSILDLFRLDGRVAVVTGSGQGIGRAIAWALADAGCDVVVNARRIDDLRETADGIRARSRRALVAAHDIVDFSEQLAERATAEFGRIDVWVNNVGGSDEKDVHVLVDTTDETFRAQLELNLVSAFQGCKAAAARMSEGGAIVNITSGAGTRGSPYTGPYAAAKAGLINLTQTLALELAERGIRVNAVSPGPVVTEAFREVLGVENRIEELTRTIPLGRTGTPDDIAAIVLFLCSPAASWITGEHHLVAGGRTHRSYQYRPKQAEDA